MPAKIPTVKSGYVKTPDNRGVNSWLNSYALTSIQQLIPQDQVLLGRFNAETTGAFRNGMTSSSPDEVVIVICWPSLRAREDEHSKRLLL